MDLHASLAKSRVSGAKRPAFEEAIRFMQIRSVTGQIFSAMRAEKWQGTQVSLFCHSFWNSRKSWQIGPPKTSAFDPKGKFAIIYSRDK
jgi:hypothetical protein